MLVTVSFIYMALQEQLTSNVTCCIIQRLLQEPFHTFADCGLYQFEPHMKVTNLLLTRVPTFHRLLLA
jgi:hypothetical protein